MKYRFVFIIILICSRSLFGQLSDHSEKTMQVQLTEKGDSFFLIQKNLGYDSLRFPHQAGPLTLLYIQYHGKGGKTSIIILDTILSGYSSTYSYQGLCSIFKNAIGGMHSINILFTDTSHGFVYGNFYGYGPYPFLKRTMDGGKSWVAKEDLPMPTEFFKENFSMLTPIKGFILLTSHYELSDNKIRYYMTHNGGGKHGKKK